MPSLRPSTGSASALLRSANSLSTQNATYEDSVQAYIFAQSAYTDSAFSTYADYLTGRINNLQSAGGISNVQKALTLTRTLDSANRSNVSASITRENIQIMAGNATLQDKYNLVRDQFVRASANGDMTLAQGLMSQAYSISQQIQYQAQQAADAASALAKAGASSAKAAQAGKVTTQNEIVTSLNDGLKELNAAAKQLNEKDFNAYSQKFVDANKDTFASLGVVIPKGITPNYFDIVQGIVGAKYNALVLKAQAEAPINPQTAQNYAADAWFLNSGVDKVQTLAGSLSLQEIQQAAVTPNMFVYNSTKGTFDRSTVTGYTTQSFTDATGSKYNAVVPTYSGYTDGTVSSKFYFLTANETAQISSLGLQVNAKVGKDGVVGSGITVQVTNTTPEWLKAIVSGETQVFNQDGRISFKSGDSYFTLSQDNKGLFGLIQHMPDGSVKLAGGDYGYTGGTTEILVSRGEQIQAQIKQANDAIAAQLKLATPPTLPNISVAPPPPPAPIGVPRAATPAARAIVPRIVTPQATAPAPQKAAPIPGATPSGNPLQGGNVRLQ